MRQRHRKKFRLLVMMTVLIAASTAAVLAASKECSDLNNEGAKALNAGKFQLAISKFEQALKMEGWMFQIRVLSNTWNTVTNYLLNKAENGGTYNTQSCLLLQKAGSGNKLRQGTAQ